ncbi:MAG: glycerol kinase GlpK [Candidatus Cloacimonetes bacterium]|nr:glycerol kinase GlpK [Candidatus Cloacimonadota bacterium]
MKKYILAIDQGTSSCRAVLFDAAYKVIGIEQKETKTIYPQSGWVEQDAHEIWANLLEVLQGLLRKTSVKLAEIAGIGITNQRETTVVWDKTGKPVYNAIIWQDTRTAEKCRQMQNCELAGYIPQAAGLVINPYFSATKLAWILENVPGARAKAANGELLFGTIDSWLIWNLTAGKLHITDYSNASRTMLFNINDLKWDEKILQYLNIPLNMLPEVQSSSQVYGETARDVLGESLPIAGIAGDQQAALYGQGCFTAGTAKNTYGTGCFLLMNTGGEKVISRSNLLTTIAWEIEGQVTYALEGSVFMGGAIVKWLRDDLGIVGTAEETEGIAESVADNEGVYFVPAFAGLGAPYWDTAARGIICGLSSGCGKAHIVRAALEAMAFQTRDVLVCMERDAGMPVQELHVDGGAAANNFLMQFQADILGCQVIRPQQIESTVLGAAKLAARALVPCN